MARKPAPPSDDPPPGPGSWVVSFNDCMTNLLCFFVLLVTFSSFHPDERSRVVGAFVAMSNPSLHSQAEDPLNSMVEPLERMSDVTEQGSEQPTNRPPENTDSPLSDPNNQGWEAYSDRLVIALPGKEMFFAQGYQLHPDGQAMLRKLGRFLAVERQHQAVIRCSGKPGAMSPAVRMERVWAVAKYLSDAGGLPMDRFLLSAAVESSTGREQVEILLLNESVYK